MDQGTGSVMRESYDTAQTIVHVSAGPGHMGQQLGAQCDTTVICFFHEIARPTTTFRETEMPHLKYILHFWPCWVFQSMNDGI